MQIHTDEAILISELSTDDVVDRWGERGNGKFLSFNTLSLTAFQLFQIQQREDDRSDEYYEFPTRLSAETTVEAVTVG